MRFFFPARFRQEVNFFDLFYLIYEDKNEAGGNAPFNDPAL